MSGFEPELGPDGRERPRFGEYATPDEQRARIREPAPAAVPPVPVADTEPPQALPRPRTADRITTLALLVYGLVSVLTTIPSMVDYGGFATTLLAALGVDQALADPAAGRPWGIAAAVVLGGGWLLTAMLSVLALRAGRLSWWIPVVGAVVFNLVSSGLLVVPLMSDPAVWSAVEGALAAGG